VTVASRADLDALTALRNHGTFQRDLDSLVDAGVPFSLLMMDLDSFKAYNDTFGHPAGDALLQTVAKAIVGAIRKNDQAYRYGGDEFALLLRGATRSHVAEVAERVRNAVRKAVTTSSAGPPGLVVSASVGAAHWPADGLAKADLVLSADQELYQAKRRRGQQGVRTEEGAEAERPISAELDRAAGLVHGSLLEAAHEMLAAPGLAEIADATLRHAVKIVGAKDAFLAMVVDFAPGSSGRTRTARPAMRLLAGSGEFQDRKLRIRRGTGFWGRVWQEASTLSDGRGSGTGLVGVPLAYDGQVVGLLGLVAPDADGVTNERLHQLSRLAALASAAAASAGRRWEGATSGAVPKPRTA
jgi:diguanylate cyclase (GGDEF)-like protein